jgi:hypothetical protein
MSALSDVDSPPYHVRCIDHDNIAFASEDAEDLDVF